MFANLLNKEEKDVFLELIFKIATCDGEYAEEEKELIKNYEIELGVSDIKDTADIEGLISFFANKEERLQKIVFFELYGMIMADGNIVSEEERILKLLKDILQLKEEVFDNIISVADELQKVYDKVYNVLFE